MALISLGRNAFEDRAPIRIEARWRQLAFADFRRVLRGQLRAEQ